MLSRRVSNPAVSRLALLAAAVSMLCQHMAQAQALPGNTYDWQGNSFYSSLSGIPNPMGVSDTLVLGGGGTKFLDVNFTQLGQTLASDTLTFWSNNSYDNQGLYDFQADAGINEYYGGSVFLNSGTLRKSGGTGVSYITSSFVNQGGTIDVQTGTLQFAAGNVQFNNGSTFQGPGQVVVSGNAQFVGNIYSSNLVLSGAQFNGGDGSVGSMARLHGPVTWQGGGVMTGEWQNEAASTLTFNGGGSKYLMGTLNNQGNLVAGTDLTFWSFNQLNNLGVYDIVADVSMGQYYGGSVFNNQGVLRKSGGSGTTSVGVSYVQGPTGLLDVQSGVVQFYGPSASFEAGTTIQTQAGSEVRFVGGTLYVDAATQWLGSGQVTVGTNAVIAGKFGAENLAFVGGSYTGGNASTPEATLVSDAVWRNGGTFAGNWVVDNGYTFTIDSSGSKYIQGNLENRSTVRAAGQVTLWANNLIDNQGLYDLQDDVGVNEYYGGSVFKNSGTLRKSGGAGVSYITSSFTNNGGLIDVQSGTLQFAAGTVVFNDGSTFQGPGQVVVSANAQFVGDIHSSNLVLAGAQFTGGDGSVGSLARLIGPVTWRDGGTMTGVWHNDTGSTLTLSGGGGKYLIGNLTNDGTVAAGTDLSLWYTNQLVNNRLYDLQGDVSVADYYGNSMFVNNATLRKSSGSGISYITSGFTSNAGVVDVQSGTVQFAAGNVQFNDGSTFQGPGQVVVSSGARFIGNIHSSNLVLSGAQYTGGDGSVGSMARLHGPVTWQGGGSLTGVWQNEAGSTFKLNGGGGKYLFGTLHNQGTVVAETDLTFWYYNQITNQGVFKLNGDVSIGDYYGGGVFTNNGVLQKSAGTGTSYVSVAVQNTPTGVVQVDTGRLQLAQNLNNEGTVKGTGTLVVPQLLNMGHVAPGASPGTLTLEGNYVQTAAGALDIEINSALTFDQLVVTGTAALDGVLNLYCFGSCQVSIGDSFKIIDAADMALSGTFSSTVLHGWGTAMFDVVYDTDHGDVFLQVTQGYSVAAAVPEPEEWALALSGLGVLALSRRKFMSKRAA